VKRRLAAGTALLLLIAFGVPSQGADWPDLRVPAPRTGEGAADAAVIVGIEDYMAVDPVPGARDNADAWFVWFTRTRGLPISRVKLLRDRDATDAAILDAARAAAEAVEPGGTLWFVFIGHGAPTEDGRDGLLVGVDAQGTALGIRTRSVLRSELLATLEAGRQARTVAVLDACFSGRTWRDEPLAEDLQFLVPEYASAGDGSSTVLTATRADQFAGPLPGLGRPAFSYLVLGALRGWGDRDGDGAVTAREAIDYAAEALVVTVRDRRQEPQLFGPGEAAPIARGGESGPDLVAHVLEDGGGSSAPDAGSVVVSGGSDDYAERVAELERARREREEAERREREARELLERQQAERLGAAEAELRSRASDHWAATSGLRQAGGPEAVTAVEDFVASWDGATVRIDGVAPRSVEVAELGDARRWLETHRSTSSPTSSSPVSGGSVLSRHGYSLIRIPAGEFQMGSPSSEAGRDADERQHRVVLTRGFLLGRTEVTQELYEAVMGSNPSRHIGCGDCPVEQVSWLDAVTFCNRLSELEGLNPAYRVSGESVSWDRSSNGYRLPTEAEWEYAARGGESTLYSGSDRLEEVGWFEDNSGKKTRSVGGLAANAWGLQDMTGNVWERVWDAYASDYPSTAKDPVVDGGATSKRVSRGGSGGSSARLARVAIRARRTPSNRHAYVGFRLARSE